MTQKNNYNFKKSKTENYAFPAEEIRQELKKKKGIVNIIISDDTPIEEKMKYSVSQSILTYQQKNKKSFEIVVKEIGVPSLNEKKLIDICRGKLDNFCLGELVVYALNLGINSIPCYHCGVNLFPSLLEALVLSLREQENLSVKGLNIYKKLGKHQDLTHGYF